MAKQTLREGDYFTTICSVCHEPTEWHESLGEKPLCSTCYDRMINYKEQKSNRKYIAKKRLPREQKKLSDILPKYQK